MFKLANKVDRGVFLRESWKYEEAALGSILTSSGLLGLRPGPWGLMVGIKWWGKMMAFSCLILSQIVLILTKQC